MTITIQHGMHGYSLPFYLATFEPFVDPSVEWHVEFYSPAPLESRTCKVTDLHGASRVLTFPVRLAPQRYTVPM
jgi:hypothetical protein